MSKSYYSIGLMSGTSMDGVDASIIQSDGETKYKVIIDKYFEYPAGIFQDLTKLRYKIKSSKDLLIVRIFLLASLILRAWASHVCKPAN